MMNEFQRRILAEAAKFGGAAVSKNDKMANAINEATPFLMGSGGGGTMFGYSKQQFEAKMRQLLQKMGFEKGINKMDVTDKKMVLYFANAAKARDFIITFNGLTKRQSKGSPATISTSFDKVKSPAGTNAVVTVDFSMLKTEGLENESHLFIVLESLHEEYVTEGGVKAALEDFMYSLPKAAIDELKTVMKKKGSVAQQVMRLASITAILNKHGVAKKLMGYNTANLVNDYFDTFHGESVEVEGEQLSEEQQVIGKYRFTSFTEGSISGWMISVQNIGEVGFIEAPAKKNTKSSIAPHKVFKTKGESEGNPKLVLIAYPDSSTRFVNDKEVRFAPRQLLKAVAMWMDKHGKVMTEETQFVEDGEIEEAKEKYLTGPGKKDPKRLVGIYSSTGKWIKDMGSEAEARKFVNKSWGESVEEETEELTEATPMQKQADFIKGLPAAAVKDIRALKLPSLKGGVPKNIPMDKMEKLTDILKKHKVKLFNNSDYQSAIVIMQWFDTVHKEEVEVSEQFKAGDKVKVPHKGKMVSGKIVRFDDGGTSKAQQHGGGYVVDVGEPASILVPKQKVQKEEVEITEAKIAFKKILKGIDDAQGPFTVVVMRADAPGAMMQKKVSIASALPAHINHMVEDELKGKKWKAIVIENSKGQVVNVLRPTDIKEEVEVSEAVDGPWENSSIVGIKSQRVAGWKTELKTARGHGGAPHGHQVYFLYHDGKGNFTVYHGDSLGKAVPAASAKKPVGVFKSKEDAMAGAKKDAASLHREEVEVNESWWDSSTLSKKDADSLLDDLESAYKKGGLRGQFKAPNGDSGPVWEMIDGLRDFLRGEPKNMVAYVLKGVKDFLSPTDRNDSRIKKVFESLDVTDETVVQEELKTKSKMESVEDLSESTTAVALSKTALGVMKMGGVYKDGITDVIKYLLRKITAAQLIDSLKKKGFDDPKISSAIKQMDRHIGPKSASDLKNFAAKNKFSEAVELSPMAQQAYDAFHAGGGSGLHNITNFIGTFWFWVYILGVFGVVIAVPLGTVLGSMKNAASKISGSANPAIGVSSGMASSASSKKESFTEDGEAISESVSATKEYRQKKIQANRRLIVKLGTAAQKVEDTAARREINQTLSTADAYNRKLGGPEMMKSSPAYWVNFEGIYVGRELGRVEGLLKHHGVIV